MTFNEIEDYIWIPGAKMAHTIQRTVTCVQKARHVYPTSPDLGCCMNYSSPVLRRENLQTREQVESWSSSYPEDSPVENKEAALAVLVEEDRGYSSTSGHDQTENSPELQNHKRPRIEAPQVTFTNDDIHPSLEWGEEEVTWNIGPPIFESSLCQPTGIIEEPYHIDHSYNATDSTFGTTYDESLQVQVKSKVEIPSRPGNNKRALEPRAQGLRSPRSIMWNKVEWERKKKQYMASVTSHMSENREFSNVSAALDERSESLTGAQKLADILYRRFVSELENLMTQVSELAGSNGARWQHPSDLTRRNYQERFGNKTPSMTLSEWQAKNLKTHKRFNKVPKIFERSPFP